MSVFNLALAAFRQCFGECAGRSNYDTPLDNASSELLSNYSRSSVNRSSELRSVFSETVVAPVHPVQNHTHGLSAANRSTAVELMHRIALDCGYDPVSIQGSASDERKGREMTRHYRWGKDLLIEPVSRDKRENDLLVMVDVDYHLDMVSHLAHHFRPILMHTLQPSAVCKDAGEYKYHFLADNKIHYFVAGGGEYKHLLWNWSGDSVSVTRYFLGIPITYSVFSIERRKIDDDHQVVLLAPVRKFTGVFATWLARRRVLSRQLERLKVVDRGFARLLVNTSSGMVMHTGVVGGWASAQCSASVDTVLASAFRTGRKSMTLAAVRSKMEGSTNDRKLSSNAEMLYEYHLAGPGNVHRVDVLEGTVRRFQWVDTSGDYDREAKVGMVAFMQPLIDLGWVPDSCYNNDKRAAEARVLALADAKRKKRKPKKDGKTDFDGISRFDSTCMDEFIQLLLMGEKHFLSPCSVADVYEKQDRPTQRRILDRAQHENSNSIAANFGKKEAYGKPTDPRMITTINPKDKLEYSQFIYPLADMLKKHDWYAFGKSPAETAQRVADICQSAEFNAGITDFSRMDGNVDSRARTLEKRLMARAFKYEFIPKLLALMRKQYNLRGVTKFGFKYETGWARSSGSAETSAFNTILNAFIAYLGYRKTMDINKAWEMLGIYGGDDGLSKDMVVDHMSSAAARMGQTLTCEVVERSAFGISFLSRHYGPNVWTGDTNSCCDILRQLSKFHLTVQLPSNISPAQKLLEKSYAFSLTDTNTPIIGEFVTRALDLWPKRLTFDNALNIWGIEENKSRQYPNTYQSWMDDLVTKQLPNFHRDNFSSWLHTTDKVSIMRCPGFMERPAVEITSLGTVVVDGSDIITKSTSESTETDAEAESVSSASTIEEVAKRYRNRTSSSKENHSEKSGSAKTRRGKHTPRRAKTGKRKPAS
uniref:RNA replicase n=1 Tax=Hubei noda-like virus 3 TaxID=1922983 RepID=A0A1L3KGB7_9VIRU|nr:hypothetical protein [Hubei noda-like virus 3]